MGNFLPAEGNSVGHKHPEALLPDWSCRLMAGAMWGLGLEEEFHGSVMCCDILHTLLAERCDAVIYRSAPYVSPDKNKSH